MHYCVTCYCMRWHPGSKYALLYFVLLLMYKSCICEDTLQLESMHCCVTCLVSGQALYARTRGHLQTGKHALLCYLSFYCTSLVCDDTLQPVSMHCYVTCLVTVQALYAMTPSLLSYLSCFCSFVCADTLQLASMHCCVMETDRERSFSQCQTGEILTYLGIFHAYSWFVCIETKDNFT